MTLTKAPVKGMKDILPEEMALRDYAIAMIKDVYSSYGFMPIETPCMEHIGNLTSKQGGENEGLIFKVMKRGEKLSFDGASSPDDLAEYGLRYDLTVPLCRYYANNLDQLPSPFKALQIGSVWRADRPQKGRFRQFTQCDIDVLGDGSMLAEIELLTATSSLLGELGFRGFTLRLNHRQLLKAMAEYAGFPPSSNEKVFIILDKMDKLGMEGVSRELLAEGLPPVSVEAYMAFFQPREGKDLLQLCAEKLTPGDADSMVPDIGGGRGVAGAGAAANIGNTGMLSDEGGKAAALALEELRTIIACMEAIRGGDGQGRYRLVFDPTLVRGMGYYTGPIFEISTEELGSSIAGGGRYDQLVGSFTNVQAPACGFSIGFERIISILMDKGFSPPAAGKKIAFLAEKGLSKEELCAMLSEAGRERRAGATVLVTVKNKNSKFQREQLVKGGYAEFRNFHRKSSS